MNNEHKKRRALNKRRLRQGWELRCWRMSSPHNYWLQGRRLQSSDYLEKAEAMDLVEYATYMGARVYHSAERVPVVQLGFRKNSDAGLPRETIWRLR